MMTTKNAARLGIKLLGIYGIIFAASQLQGVGWTLAFTEQARGGEGFLLPAIVSGGSLVISFGLGFFLLLRGDQVTQWTFPDAGKAAESSEQLSGLSLQAIAVSVLGLFFVMKSLPQMLQLISMLVAIANAGHALGSWSIVLQQLGMLTGGLLQFVLGGILFFQARGLARFWHGLQSARRWRAKEN